MSSNPALPRPQIYGNYDVERSPSPPTYSASPFVQALSPGGVCAKSRVSSQNLVFAFAVERYLMFF